MLRFLSLLNLYVFVNCYWQYQYLKEKDRIFASSADLDSFCISL